MAPAQGLGDQLAKLAALRASGALSDDEFTAAKAKLLGTPEPGLQDQPPPGGNAW